MSSPLAADRTGLVDGVVGVELTIDGMLVIADKLQLAEFPTVLAIRQNIPHEELRTIVWDQVRRDLTAQGVLDFFGTPHPAVGAMIDTLSRPDRALQARWWRCDADETMVRFVVCRKGDRHVIAVRDAELLVLQLVAPQIGLAGMVATVLGPAGPAAVEPLTGLATQLAECRTEFEVARHGVERASARLYAEIIANPSSWVEIIASERHSGGTSTDTDAAAGVLDSARGRLVSLPRREGGELYGSFLPGSPENLQRALEALLAFLPSGGWSDSVESDHHDAHLDR